MSQTDRAPPVITSPKGHGQQALQRGEDDRQGAGDAKTADAASDMNSIQVQTPAKRTVRTRLSGTLPSCL